MTTVTMSDCHKHKLLLMEQLELLGCTCFQEGCNKDDSISINEHDKIKMDNMETMKRIEDLQQDLIETDGSKLNIIVDEKEKMNKKIQEEMKKTMEGSEDCNDVSSIEKEEQTNAHPMTWKKTHDSHKRDPLCSKKRIENSKEEMSNCLFMSLEKLKGEMDWDTKAEMYTSLMKEALAIMIEVLKRPKESSDDTTNLAKRFQSQSYSGMWEKILLLIKSFATPSTNKDNPETTSTFGDDVEDTNKLEQGDCEETSIKELYSVMSPANDKSTDINRFCSDAVVMQEKAFRKEKISLAAQQSSLNMKDHDWLSEHKNIVYSETDEIEPKRSIESPSLDCDFLRVQGDGYGISELEKGEQDTKDTEKMLDILDDKDDLREDQWLAPDKITYCEDFEEAERRQDEEKNVSTDSLSSSIHPCQYEGIDSFPVGNMKSIDYGSGQLEIVYRQTALACESLREQEESFDINFIKSEVDHCDQRKERKLLLSNTEPSKVMWSLNELSSGTTPGARHCFQNNIVSDSLFSSTHLPSSLKTLGRNIFKSQSFSKCNSKTFFLSLESIYGSNSCNFAYQTNVVCGIPQQKRLENESAGKLPQSSFFVLECKQQQTRLKKKRKANGSQIETQSRPSFDKNDTDRGQGQFVGKKCNMAPKEKKMRKSLLHVEKWQKRHRKKSLQSTEKDIPNSTKPTHLGHQTAKLRKHTGAKGSQSGGGRGHGNSGVVGGGGGQQRRGSGSSGSFQSSGSGNQGCGSGGDDPDDHDSRKRKEYGRNKSSSGGENGDKNKTKNGADASNKHSNEHGNTNRRVQAWGTANARNVVEGGGDGNYSGALPNLPRPVWDASTMIQRQAKESLFQYGSSGPSQSNPQSFFLPPPSASSKDQPDREDQHDHRRDSAPDLTFEAARSNGDPTLVENVPVPNSAPVSYMMAWDRQTPSDQNYSKKHAMISPTQLCEIIGHATNYTNVPAALFESFDICLTKVMHDLCFSLQETNETPGASDIAARPSVFEARPKSEMKQVPGTTHNRNGFLSEVDTGKSTVPVPAAGTDDNVQQPSQTDQIPGTVLKEAPESVSSPLGCTVCLVVSGLLTHLSHCRKNSCMQCAQILNLMTQHTHKCVAKGRLQQRITSSDLCYKICKKGLWCAENILCDSAAFKGKIQKYCDKALCKGTENPGNSSGPAADSSLGIGEMESLRGQDALSSGANSSTSFSFSGNPIAVESGSSMVEKSSLSPLSKLGRDLDSVVSGTAEARNSSFSSIPFTSNQAVVTSSCPSNVPSASATSIGGKAHRSLVRKPSSRSPAIPQPIEEVSDAAEEGLAAEGQNSQNDSNIRDIIYRRYGPKGSDPYDTQPTFGDKKGYESMPQGILHDQEQFFSFGNRAVGTPGIGEVVFGNQKQLRLVAGFWERKREDCERTRTSPPYQHREEGVILSQYKMHFSILRTRYQKHHQWERVAHLGNGMSGKCHLVTDLKTEFKFCCKKVHLLKYSKEEVNLWSELNHSFIVKLYGAIRHGVKIYIFCEFIDGGSLATCIEEQKRLGQRFSHWSALNYFHQLLKVLAYLQSKDVLHEDIKADNILLRNGCTYIALTDFGTSRRLCDPKELMHKSPVGSPAHWSPEKAASQGHGFPSDLWAALCVLIHMLSGDPPWMRRFMKSATILNFIIYSREPPLEDVPPNVQPMVRNLIASGLVKDSANRPSAEKLLGHEAFRILQNRQPDRYYSSLGGCLSQAALLAKANDAERTSQILYSREIPTGPYQESVGQSTNSRDRGDNEGGNAARCEEEASTTTSDEHGVDEPGGIPHQEQVDREQDTSGERNDNIPIRLNEASTRLLNHNKDAHQEGEGKARPEAKDSQHIPDLDALFSNLVPDESKAFYNDAVPDGAEALKQSSAKQQQLVVFIPEEKRESQLPNLSIFGTDLSDGSGTATFTQRSPLELVPESQQVFPQLTASNRGEEDLRSSLSSARLAESSNAVSFILSSESEDYTSAELFNQGSMTGPETMKNSTVSHETEPPVTLTNSSHAQGAGKSPQNDSHATLSPPAMSNSLQQRNTHHLKLNLSPTSTGSPSQAFGAGISSGSTEVGSGAASNKSWRGAQSHRTPSTGRLSSRLSNSTAGSRTSPLPFPFKSPGSSSVLEEQDKLMQMLRAEQESLSSSGSDFLIDVLNEDPGHPQADNEQDRMGDAAWQFTLSRLQENIEISSLEGHGLHLYDENTMEVVLPVRFSERPVSMRELIENISGRLSQRYGHFNLFHLDKSALNFSTPLEADKLLVRQLPESEKGCLCDGCRLLF